MKSLIVFLLILFHTSASAQLYINKSRQKVRSWLEQQKERNDSLSITISDTDTSLIYSIKDPKILPADFHYIFDESGKCIEEKTIAYCDSCFNKFLVAAISRKQFQWKKLNDNLYISGYSRKLMLEIPAGNKDHSFTIRRMKWTRNSYRTLLKMQD